MFVFSHEERDCANLLGGMEGWRERVSPRIWGGNKMGDKSVVTEGERGGGRRFKRGFLAALGLSRDKRGV